MVKLKKKFDDYELRITIDEVGAQIIDCCAVVNGVEVHLMHNGATTEGTSWNATAKNLFPNPGPVLPKEYDGFDERQIDVLTSLNAGDDKNKTITHRGGLYRMPQHGIAPLLTFKSMANGEDYSVLVLQSGDNTTTMFPNKFNFSVITSLLDNALGFSYRMVAENRDTKPMVAGIGWHPSFAMPFGKENYKIVVKNNATGKTEEYSAADIIDKGKATSLKGGDCELSLIYVEPTTNTEYLVVKMDTKEKELILWGRNGQNSDDFVCLEPWNTESRKVSLISKKAYMSDDDLYGLRKDGAVILPPDQSTELNESVSFGTDYLNLLAATYQAKHGGQFNL